MEINFTLNTAYYFVAALAVGPGLIGLGMFLYMWYKIPRTLITLMFLIFILFCSVWQISEGMIRLAKYSEAAIFWNRCTFLSIMPVVVTGLHFALLFVGNKKLLRTNLFFFTVYFPGILFTTAIVLNFATVRVVKSETWNWKSDPDLSLLVSAMLIWIALISAATMYQLTKHALNSRKKNIIIRRRSMLLAIGYLIPSILGVVFQIIFPEVLGLEEIPVAAPAILFFTIASFIALKKYKLFSYSTSFPASRILDIMNEGVLIIDTENKIRYSNSGFCKITGFDKEELMGKPVVQLGSGYLPEISVKSGANKFIYPFERYEQKILGKDGANLVVYQNHLPYIDKTGDTTGTIILFTDISEISNSKEKIRHEKRHALHYQSMLLSAQLNPHFIFNSLNSIQYYILAENKEPALEYLSEFSRLMRSVLQNSIRDHITLSEEIIFLQSYLDLEVKRLRGKFSYTIDVVDNEESDDLLLPPMLLQPYIENSIIHGLGLIDYHGILSIRFFSINDGMVCEISDNGVGRKRADELKELRKGPNKSHGMSLTKTRIEVLNIITEQPHFVQIDDINDENGVVKGTKVAVHFPKLF